MQLFDQLQQLLDLPDTFKRQDFTYLKLMTSIAAALTLLTESSEGLLDETLYDDATDGWIDVWAALAGIPRRTGEGNETFRERVRNMLLAWRDSAVAIERWLKLVENLPNTIVTENLPRVGYSVTVPATLTQPQLAQVLKDLAWVRPAGMPFNFIANTGGTFLTTVNYLSVAVGALALSQQPAFVEADDEGTPGSPRYYIEVIGGNPSQGRVTGSYLASTVDTTGLGPNALTDNQPSLIPDLLLTDPVLNPSLQGPV